MKILVLSMIATAALVGCRNNREKVYAVDELANAVVAQKEAFMGKEVVVHGYIAHQPSVEGNGYTLSLKFDRGSHKERQLSCNVLQAKIPDEISKNWMNMDVTVKGKIADIHSQNYMDLKSVELEPCELMRAE